MPTFEVEMGGKTFDVEAPSIEHFMSAYQASGGEAAQPQPPETGFAAVGRRIMTWPGRIAETVKDAVTLPRDVYQGKTDVWSPEGQERAGTLASMISPGSPASGFGRQVARRATMPGKPNPDFKPVAPSMEAGQIAADLGAPLPAGIVSEKPGVQGFTEAARALPLVGAKIDERLGDAVKAAGAKVDAITNELGGATTDRAVAGANLRQSLQDVITNNNARIDSVYGAVRNVIDPDRVAPGSMANTGKAVNAILKERIAAGMKKPEDGLKDIINLANKGGSFNGLQRARADVGKTIGLAANNANPGFNVGDFKRIYAAMSGDLANAVKANVKPGVNSPNAAMVWQSAESAAEELIGRNKSLQRLLNVQSDQSLSGSVIDAARNRGGNARLLMQLRQQMPKRDFEEITALGLSELGHNTATDSFSLSQFATGWNKLSDSAKSILFADPTHRKALDDISKLGGFLKDADKYANKSGTGRAVGVGDLVKETVKAVKSINVGEIAALVGHLATGGLLTRVLARPATANSLRKWILTAQTKEGALTPARRAALGLATRNLLSNLRDVPGFDALAGADSAKPAPRKLQDRASAP